MERIDKLGIEIGVGLGSEVECQREEVERLKAVG
jgi:hypothetical protein